jgi:tRNA (cmo5U34)-methyltransferase
VCLFTLQFLTWPDRLKALTLARDHSGSTGALIIAEKIRPPDSRWASAKP